MSIMSEGEKIARLLMIHGYEVTGSDRPMICPYCGQKKFYLNIGKGLFCCKRTSCEASNGGNYFAIVNHFYDGEDRYKQAAKDLGCVNEVFERKIHQMPTQDKPEAPIELRAPVYNEMVKHPLLAPVARNELHRRGLTDAQIKKWGFSSLPVLWSDRSRIANYLHGKEIVLDNVPGFIKVGKKYAIADFGLESRMKAFGATGNWYDYYSYLIPSMDLYGNVQFFQIGWDKRLSGKVDGDKWPKYSTFSNPKNESGGKAKASCGYVGAYKTTEDGRIIPDLKGQTKIPIIEGTLKSILYHEFTGCREAVISQVGVVNQKSVREFLLKLKEICPEVDTIIDCYDMDKITLEDAMTVSDSLKRKFMEYGREKMHALMNKDVRLASEKLKKTVESCGYKYEKRLWDPQYKGIDDLLYAKIIAPKLPSE